ncbi:MAG: TIGR00730 family Rossman fold protein [Oscillospiraceae bacterium]|nr:TIGR00730 family Rossman fold protein [Oscillospiraceae bacterium]
MKICVFGAASPTIDEKYIKAVEELGEIMARRGHELVFGAGANGLMGAAARGVKRGGGRIHGVIPTFFEEEDIEAIYQECDELTFTASMRERKQTMEDCADAFIITPGGIGTFEEFYEILTLKQLGRHQKPIVIFNIEHYFNDLLAVMNCAVREGFITEKCLGLYTCVGEAEQAVRFAEDTDCLSCDVSELKKG